MILAMLIMVVLTATLCVVLIPLARKTGLVDHPGERRIHETVTPLTGGPAIFVAFAIITAFLISNDPFIQALAAGGLILFLVGLIDDYIELSAGIRLLAQITACLVVILHAGVCLEDFGRLFRDNVLTLGGLSTIITIFAALGVINSFNMIDGMDGLAGGIFMVAAMHMAWLAGAGLQMNVLLLLLMMFAAVLGFMLLNARFPWNEKGRVFLGDSGSLLLGFVLAWSFITLGNDHNAAGQRAFMPITAVWLIAVPLLDTSTLIWRRWQAGKSAMDADQYHLHHAFLRAGFSVSRTWFAIVGLAAALAGAGIVFEVNHLPDYLSFWSFLAFAFAYHFYMKDSWRIQRFLGRDFIYNDFNQEQEKEE